MYSRLQWPAPLRVHGAATHRARHQLQHLREVQLGLRVCRWRKAIIRDERSRNHLLVAPRGVHPVACRISAAAGNSPNSRRLLILARRFFTGAFRAFGKCITEPWTLTANIPSYRQAPLGIPAPPSGPQFSCWQGTDHMPWADFMPGSHYQEPYQMRYQLSLVYHPLK